jgi:hypothetical protein
MKMDNEEEVFDFPEFLDPREQRRRLSLAIKNVIKRDSPDLYFYHRRSSHSADFTDPEVNCPPEHAPTTNAQIEKSKLENPTKKFIKRKNSKKLSLKMSLSTDSQSSSTSDDLNSA